MSATSQKQTPTRLSDLLEKLKTMNQLALLCRQKVHKIRVADFDQYPGGRPSVKAFRDNVLIPAIKQHNGRVSVNLDNGTGYGSSYLHEIFGKLITSGVSEQQIQSLQILMVSSEDPSLIIEINDYIDESMREMLRGNERVLCQLIKRIVQI